MGDVTVHKPADMTCMTWIFGFIFREDNKKRSKTKPAAKFEHFLFHYFRFFDPKKNPNIKHLLMDLVVCCSTCSLFFSADFILILLPNWD